MTAGPAPDVPGIDLRLVPAAVTCWTVTAAGVWWGPWAALTVVVIAVAAVVGVGLRVGSVRWPAVLAVAAVGAAFAIVATVRVHAVDSHPLASRFGTTVAVTVTPTESPKTIQGGRLMFSASLQRLQDAESSGRVMVFAPAVGYSEVSVGRPMAFRARVTPPKRRDLSVAVLAVALATGVRSVGALIGFWLVGFVIAITLYDYGRAIWARHKRSHEPLPVAFWNLVGRNRRRYGGYIIHLGIVLMALGIIGIEMFQTQTQQTLRPGQSLTLGQYSLTYDSLAIFDTQDGRNVARAVVSVDRGGQAVSELYPRVDYYYDSGEQVTIPGLRSTAEDDLYVVLVDWKEISTSGATFKVFHNPLVSWLWIGGIVFILGTLVAAWPDRDPDYKKSR